MSGRVIVLRGDAASLPLPDASVDLIATSPPFWGLRDYEGGEGRRPVAVADPASTPGWALSQRKGRSWHGDGASPTRALGVTAADRSRRITGYACACPDASAPTRPAVALDPFGGSGTTAMVASVLRRTGISVDLSHDYGRIARWRTSDPAERARALGLPKPPPVIDGQGSLFDDLGTAS